MYGAFNPNFNQQYQQDLMNMRERIDRQLQQVQNQPQFQQPAPITQNFQLAPNQSQNGIKYANSIDDVKKELVFADTLFVDKEYTQLWLKNALGEIKTYKLEQVIEIDEKDRKIAELTAKINMLESEMKNNESTTNSDANVNATNTKSKSSSVSNGKSSNK